MSELLEKILDKKNMNAAYKKADVLVRSAAEGLDLLLCKDRLRATLRT